MYCKLLKINKKLETLDIEEGDLVYFRFEAIRQYQKIIVRPKQIYNVNKAQEISIKNNFDCVSKVNNFQFEIENIQAKNSNKKLIVLSEKSQFDTLENEFKNLFVSQLSLDDQEDCSIKALTLQMKNLFLGDQEIATQDIIQNFLEFKLS